MLCKLQWCSLTTVLLGSWWRRRLTLLECLGAQGTFLQQSAFCSIGFPYEVKKEKKEKYFTLLLCHCVCVRVCVSVRGWGTEKREKVCKKIQIWRNIVKLQCIFLFSVLFYLLSFHIFFALHAFFLKIVNNLSLLFTYTVPYALHFFPYFAPSMLTHVDKKLRWAGEE